MTVNPVVAAATLALALTFATTASAQTPAPDGAAAAG